MTKMNHINKNKIVGLLVSILGFVGCGPKKEYVSQELKNIDL